MKYAVDKIENNIVVLENIQDKTIIEIELDKLPPNIKEGNILLYENNTYTIDIETEQKRRETINSKFAMLRKK